MFLYFKNIKKMYKYVGIVSYIQRNCEIAKNCKLLIINRVEYQKYRC